MAIMPRNINPETKIGSFIMVTDFFFLIFYNVIITWGLSEMVHPSLKVLFFIYSGIISLVLTIPSNCNCKKRFYMSVLFFLLRSKCVYKPIHATEEDRRQEEIK